MTDVSVLTPSYQYAHFLPDALASVAQQRGVSVEHIVQDGGSTDGTLEILEEAGPIVRWHSEPDSGIGDALNRALQQANGRWVAWLNADEFYLSGALAQMCEVGDREGATVVYGDAAYVDENGRLRRLLSRYPFDERILQTYGPLVPTHSMLIRRDALGIEPWNPEIRGIAEIPLLVGLVRTGATFHYVPRAFGAYRVHAAQDSLLPAGNSTLNRRHLGAEWTHPYPPRSSRGRWLHRLLKLRSGSYLRELVWLRRRGEDMRWFARES